MSDPQGRSLRLRWGSDIDGDYYMFADTSEPDRFDWQVTVVTSGGNRKADVMKGENFCGPSTWGTAEDACWCIFDREGTVEIIVPGQGNAYRAQIGEEQATHPD